MHISSATASPALCLVRARVGGLEEGGGGRRSESRGTLAVLSPIASAVSAAAAAYASSGEGEGEGVGWLTYLCCLFRMSEELHVALNPFVAAHATTLVRAFSLGGKILVHSCLAGL